MFKEAILCTHSALKLGIHADFVPGVATFIDYNEILVTVSSLRSVYVMCPV